MDINPISFNNYHRDVGRLRSTFDQMERQKKSHKSESLPSTPLTIQRLAEILKTTGQAIGDGFKSVFENVIHREVKALKRNAVRIINSTGEKRIRNIAKVLIGAGFLAWISTLPINAIYYSTIFWIKKAADFLKPTWTVFGVVTTTLSIANGVLGTIGAVLSIHKIQQATLLGEDGQLGAALLTGTKDSLISKIFTTKTAALKERLANADPVERNYMEKLLNERRDSAIRVQKIILISQIINVIGSAIILAGLPMVGLPITMIGSAIGMGAQLYNSIQTYRFEDNMGIIARAPGERGAMLRKRDKIKDYAKWCFNMHPEYQVASKERQL